MVEGAFLAGLVVLSGALGVVEGVFLLLVGSHFGSEVVQLPSHFLVDD